MEAMIRLFAGRFERAAEIVREGSYLPLCCAYVLHSRQALRPLVKDAVKAHVDALLLLDETNSGRPNEDEATRLRTVVSQKVMQFFGDSGTAFQNKSALRVIGLGAVRVRAPPPMLLTAHLSDAAATTTQLADWALGLILGARDDLFEDEGWRTGIQEAWRTLLAPQQQGGGGGDGGAAGDVRTRRQWLAENLMGAGASLHGDLEEGRRRLGIPDNPQRFVGDGAASGVPCGGFFLAGNFSSYITNAVSGLEVGEGGGGGGAAAGSESEGGGGGDIARKVMKMYVEPKLIREELDKAIGGMIQARVDAEAEAERKRLEEEEKARQKAEEEKREREQERERLNAEAEAAFRKLMNTPGGEQMFGYRGEQDLVQMREDCARRIHDAGGEGGAWNFSDVSSLDTYKKSECGPAPSLRGSHQRTVVKMSPSPPPLSLSLFSVYSLSLLSPQASHTRKHARTTTGR